MEDFGATTTEGDESADLHEQAAELTEQYRGDPNAPGRRWDSLPIFPLIVPSVGTLDQRLWAYFAGADRCHTRSAVVILLIL